MADGSFSVLQGTTQSVVEDINDTEGFLLDLYYLPRDLRSLNDVDFSANPDRSMTLQELNPANGAGLSGVYQPNKAFAVQATADLFIETAGNYTFYVTAGNQASFAIDGVSGNQVSTYDDASSTFETAVTLYLERGSHALDIQYFERSEMPVLELEWEGPDSDGERSFLTSEDLAESSVLLEPTPEPAVTVPTAPEPTVTVDNEPAPTEPVSTEPVGSDPVPTESSPNGLFVPTPAFGNDNPTVSFNLTGVSNWSTQMPFLDIAKTMRPWMGHEPGQWGGVSFEELEAGGYLDANGWVKEIPEGLDSVGSAWAFGGDNGSDSRLGVYEMTYEGEGDINIQNVKIISSENGRIVFEVEKNANITVKIFETDPQKTGDYIRDISVVREDHADLHDAGAIFNPEWLDLVADSREFRFMDWMGTNNSDAISWEERTTAESATWVGDVPVEIMVQLANEAGVDPWFTMPHMADDEYIRQFSEYVRDNLDPNLTARVEYSNELWNWNFGQTHWMKDQAASEWGDTSGTAFRDYQIMRATQVGLIWEDVFSQVETAPTLVNVLGVQTVSEWGADRMLSGSVWKANDPDGFVDPSIVFEELAVTTYFGSKIVSDETTRLELIAAIEDPNVDATAWLTAKLMDPAQRLSIPDLLEELQQMKAVADEYGLDMVAYEGGQHVHHKASGAGVTEEQSSLLTDFLTEYVRSPDMAMLYEELWDVWAQVSDGPFMQFGDVGVPSKYGSWAILSDLDDTNQRADFLFDQMQNATPWWDAEANEAYLQGVTRTGTDANDVMIGTDEEDYLAGGDGDDEFVVGDGNDGINGGVGIDSLYLKGSSEQYAIRAQGDGHLISGPSGDKFVINVESFVFESGETHALDDLVGLLPNVLAEPETNPAPEPETSPEPGIHGEKSWFQDGPEIDGPLEIKLDGQLYEAEGMREAVVTSETADSTGVKISGVNKWSTLGTELGLRDDTGAQSAYAVYEKGSSIQIRNTDGAVQTVAADYQSIEENSAGQNGAQVSDSAVEAALLFGDIVIDPTAVHATSGNDHFMGRENDDTAFGEGGNDYLNGRAGNDNLHGGKGNDVMFGGAGADRFHLTAGDGLDRIKDFDIEDMLILTDYLEAGDTLADAAMLDDVGDLVISNGTDQVVLEGLDLDDLSWIQEG